MSSSVPAVIAAFKSVAATACPAGTQIVNSSILPAGFQSSPGDVTGINSGVTLQIKGVHFVEDQYAEMGPNYKHEEHYNIMCTLCAWEMGPSQTVFDQLMQDVYTIYADLSIAISQNMALGLPEPKPRIAWPRQLDFTPGPDPFGRPAGTITFQVEVQARVDSLS